MLTACRRRPRETYIHYSKQQTYQITPGYVFHRLLILSLITPAISRVMIAKKQLVNNETHATPRQSALLSSYFYHHRCPLPFHLLTKGAYYCEEYKKELKNGDFDCLIHSDFRGIEFPSWILSFCYQSWGYS